MVKTLLVTSNFPPVRGGSSVVYENLCRFGNGQILPLAPILDYRTGQRLQGVEEHDATAGYPVFRINLLRPTAFREDGSRRPRLARTLHDLRVVLRAGLAIARICRRERIDVICIGELVYGGWLVWPCRHLLGKPVIAYIHGEEITNRDSSSWSERSKSKFLAMCNAVIAVSRFSHTAILQLLDLPDNRAVIIPNGVDRQRFYPTSPRADLIERYGLAGKRVLLTVARVVERKGADMVLRAMPEILAACPTAHYLIVGDGPYRPELDAICAELAIGEHVTFAGDVADGELNDHYSLCDVFVMPNRELANGDTEGFGLVFLEANACGKPAISGIAGGAVDAVKDGVNGLCVDGTDPAKVAEAAIRILSDDALHGRLVEGGHKAAAAADWSTRVSQFQALAQDVAAAKASGDPVSKAALQSVEIPWLSLPRTIAELPRQAPPKLIVVIDTEEEFDWRFFSRTSTHVTTIGCQERAQRIFERFGLIPSYAIDYPVAIQRDAVKFLEELVKDGKCEIGAQLHPWVNPPIEEPAIPRNTFPGNLPPALERAKLIELTKRIEDRFDIKPRLYRAGRYGVGPNTPYLLEELGYHIDCSVIPYMDLRSKHGPDYRFESTTPFWIGPSEQILELPVTLGMTGTLRRLGDQIYPYASSRLGTALRAPGSLARLKLLNRIKLTPEGTSLAEAKLLTRTMLADRAERVFTVTYHSPSLEPGHTPYVNNQAELTTFLDWIEGYIEFFLGEMGGTLSTPSRIYAEAQELRAKPARKMAAAV
ncbi:MAG TPA: glycosyltransferase [Aliidongia sp.]|uniref:glycosyltransferase n=1 Tax=Aliidongia sp. TaxID=1914230 RepID=UPI002DDDAFC0|nr:glycosyltransferase [Aliidongia sp.]HEV2677314.1 glycosyltransferase [Aliidongia sp.]